MLRGSHGDEFSLRIVGYEFPDKDNDLGFDSNWLIVEVYCKHGEKTWVKRDPSLLTWEAGILIKWARDILYRQPESEVLEFIEPNLLFQALRGENGKIQTLRVTLGHETCPDWVPTLRKPAYFSLDFAINPEDIESFCQSLEADLLIYPRRLQHIKELASSPRDRLKIVKKDNDSI